ncbi:thioredoxin-dependent thiol peroxidase [Sphingomonas endophytica]|uniref:thioredoxin-dependent peroxiredoxin n=1 Tax=Sphingomonas endophytica TaxID=869719 RepID=A0ABR6N234_9SPHN|nr:peroxiredoxin [Sphingomonas endophytica]MBB5724821.1 peroxiredoxin Q/BCP [Sphingomonas endophytica]
MDTLPDVTATGADGAPVRLHDLPRPLVVYFYPKDDTPGCTREAQDFSALSDDFAAAGVGVLGVSRDTVAKHARFRDKHALTVALASDLDGSVTEAFGVWGEKQLYGKTYMGIDRATFLFDREAKLVHVWRKVKVPGHAAAVLDAAKAL